MRSNTAHENAEDMAAVGVYVDFLLGLVREDDSLLTAQACGEICLKTVLRLGEIIKLLYVGGRHVGATSITYHADHAINR